jgi:hypothetical protein
MKYGSCISSKEQHHSPLRAFFVQDSASAVGARDNRVLGQRHAATAIAARVGSHGADLLVCRASCASRAGASGRHLVSLANHDFVLVCGGDVERTYRFVLSQVQADDRMAGSICQENAGGKGISGGEAGAKMSGKIFLGYRDWKAVAIGLSPEPSSLSPSLEMHLLAKQTYIATPLRRM